MQIELDKVKFGGEMEEKKITKNKNNNKPTIFINKEKSPTRTMVLKFSR